MFKFFKKKIQQYKTLIKFGISGSTAAAVDFSLLYYFYDVLELSLRTSVVVAFIVAFFVSFYLQKFWTFQDGANKKAKRQMAMYLGVGLFNTMVNAFAVPFLTGLGIYYLFSQAISAAVLSIGSFLMYRYVIFKKKHKKLKKKNLFLPDESTGYRVLIAVRRYKERIERKRKNFLEHGDRVKILAFKSDEGEIDNFYPVANSQKNISKAFDYFYHMFKMANWADVVYLFANHKTVIPSFFACVFKRVTFILEVDNKYVSGVFGDMHKNNYLLGWIEKRIITNAKIIIVRDESLVEAIRAFGVPHNNIIVLQAGETIRLKEHFL